MTKLRIHIKRILRQSFRHSRLLYLILILLLTGCEADNPENLIERYETFSVTLFDHVRKNVPLERLLPGTVKTLSEEEHLYDLSDLIPSVENMAFWDYAVLGKGKLLLLYADYVDGYDPNTGMESSDPNKSCHFTLLCLDLITGKKEMLADNRDAELSFGERTMFYPEIVSTDPIVLSLVPKGVYYDLQRNWICRVSGTKDFYATLHLPQQDGRIYIMDSESNLQELRRDSLGFHLEMRWEADPDCDIFELYYLSGDQLVLIAQPKLEPNLKKVSMRIRLSSGKVEDTYTADYNTDDFPNAPINGYRITQHYGRDGINRLTLQTADGKQYTLGRKDGEDPADSYASSWRMSDGLAAGGFPVFEDCLYAKAYVDGKVHPFLWVFGATQPAECAEPEHTPYHMPRLSEINIPELEKELEEEFGIQISSGEEAPLDYGDYKSEAEKDPETICLSYFKLRNAYEKYPKEFFEQLYGSAAPLRIYLVKNLIGNGESALASAGGIESDDEKGPYIAFATNGYGVDETTIFHETTHAVYDKLMQDGFMEEFFDDWAKLNPPGFDYGYTYNKDELPDSTYTSDNVQGKNYESVYFVRDYGKTYPTEDVADLFGDLLSGEEPPAYYAGSHIQAKCRYFSALIRRGFDTNGWPEKTEWEERLDRVKP